MQQPLRRILFSEYGMAFCLSLCLLFPLTYQSWLTFDVSKTVDAKTYWELAHLNFEQSLVKKYRIIIPLIVAGLNWVVTSVVQLFHSAPVNKDLYMSRCFYGVNLATGAMWCTLAYAYVRSMGRSKIASLLAILVVATSEWTIINTYSFMTDSFFCCFVALAFLGIQRRNSKMLFWAIIIGPFIKENYVFLLPVIFFYSHIHKGKLLLWFALSGALVFSYRYIFDHITGHPMIESLGNDAEHFTYIADNSKRFLDPDYRNAMISAIGFWIFIPVGAMLFIKGFTKQLGTQLRGYMLLWLLLVLLQMLSSGDLARMFSLYLPVYSFFIAFAADAWLQQHRQREKIA